MKVSYLISIVIFLFKNKFPERLAMSVPFCPYFVEWYELWGTEKLNQSQLVWELNQIVPGDEFEEYLPGI